MKGIKLGDVVRDKITGFNGVVIVAADYLNGCHRVCVQPRELREGKIVEAEYFDVEQVERVEEEGAPRLARTGGPCPAPRRQRDPVR